MKGVIGYNGFAVSKKEGDGKSPMGIYSFGTAFGTVTKPSGMAWTYRKSTTNDYWIDAPSSKYYNKWYTSARKPAVSHEKMYQPLYKYGAVINYNTSSIVKGKGSAIFLHIWRGSNSATAGCVATEEKNVVRILKWLNPKSDPRIVMGTVDYVKKMK
ncbi:hypothetical protein D0466_09970 [Peribacillus glennii]|uniref:L,D-TPase catalytic domain-containing protein n=2 Tax=Peribacillus glennii TaxID=2303991 RepID=A0A372LDI5_9BACI|nr:hypothetical protein D0466_09970 [Peribacillus glennii]